MAGIARMHGVAVSTVHFWYWRWREGGRHLQSLFNRRAGPHSVHRRTDLDIPARELHGKNVRGIRLLRALAKQGIKTCLATLYAVLRRLGLIGRRRRKLPTASRHMDYPLGYVQADVKYIGPSGPFQFTAIECRSRVRFLRIYSELTPANAVDFARRALKFFPCKISTWSTDNGPEFAFPFRHISKLHPLTAYLQSMGVVHHLIPVGKPSYNGRVERSHRSDVEEFYSWVDPSAAGEMIAAWCRVWNELREHMALGWSTPLAAMERELGRPVKLDYRLVS